MDDIRDTRGRLVRFTLAVAIGAAVTALVMRWIASVSAAPNRDPVGGSSVGLLAIGLFVVTSAVALAALSAVAQKIAASRR